MQLHTWLTASFHYGVVYCWRLLMGPVEVRIWLSFGGWSKYVHYLSNFLLYLATKRFLQEDIQSNFPYGSMLKSFTLRLPGWISDPYKNYSLNTGHSENKKINVKLNWKIINLCKKALDQNSHWVQFKLSVITTNNH